MTYIEDCSNGNTVKVDSKRRLYTLAITEDNDSEAARDGRAYNLNTGIITLTGSSESSLMYIYNGETEDLHINSIILGVGAGTASDMGLLTLLSNPTGGDLISDASPVDIKINRNLGSSSILSTETLVYKGKDGGTITGGTNLGIFYQGTSGRLVAPFEIVLPRGSSVAMKYDPNLSSGSVDVYAAVIMHVGNGD